MFWGSHDRNVISPLAHACLAFSFSSRAPDQALDVETKVAEGEVAAAKEWHIKQRDVARANFAAQAKAKVRVLGGGRKCDGRKGLRKRERTRYLPALPHLPTIVSAVPLSLFSAGSHGEEARGDREGGKGGHPGDRVRAV